MHTYIPLLIPFIQKKISERDEALVKYESMVKTLAEKPPKSADALEKEVIIMIIINNKIII